MADEPNQGDGGTAEAPRLPDNQPVMEEYAPFGGDATLPKQDSALILSTLFGDNSGGDQGGEPGGKSPEPGKDAAAPAADPGAQSGGAQPTPGGQAAQPGGDREGGEKPPFPGAPGSQKADGTQQQSPGSATAQPAATPPASSMTAEERLTMENLKTMVTSLQAQLAGKTAAPTPTPTPAASETGTGDQKAPGADQMINLSAPAQVLGDLLGEDPNKQGAALNWLLSQTATAAYRHALEQTTKLIDNKFAGYSSEQARYSEGEKITQDYYSAFPKHNDPLFGPLVQSEYGALVAEMPGVPWNENMRNALGTRVNAKLTTLGFTPEQLSGQQEQQQQTPTPTPPAPKPNGRAKPAPMLDGGTRPAPSGEGGNFIRDTLG